MAIQFENLDTYIIDRHLDYYGRIDDNYKHYFGDFNEPSYYYTEEDEIDFAPVITSPDEKYYSSTSWCTISQKEGAKYSNLFVNKKSNNQTHFTIKKISYGITGYTSDDIVEYESSEYLVQCAEDDNFLYYLLCIADSINNRSGSVIIRVQKDIDFFEDDILYIPDIGDPDPDNTISPADYISLYSDQTSVWHPNTTGELAVIWPNKTNFTHDLHSSSRAKSEILGYSSTKNAFFVYENDYNVEKYSYDPVSNAINKVSVLNIQNYGSIKMATYDYSLDLVVVLVWNVTDEAYKLVIIETSKNSVWAVGGPYSFRYNTDNLFFNIVGVESLHGAYAITTFEVGKYTGSYRGVRTWLVYKTNLVLDDFGEIAPFSSYSDRDFTTRYDNRSSWVVYLGPPIPKGTVSLTDRSFRIFEHFALYNVEGTSYDPELFIVGNVSFNSELYSLDNNVPKNTSVGLIYFSQNIGMSGISGDLLTLTINPEAWGTRHDIGFSINAVMKSNVAKLTEDVLFEMNGMMEWMTINLELEMTMLAGINCIDRHEIDSAVTASIIGVSETLEVNIGNTYSELFNDVFNFTVATRFPPLQLGANTGNLVELTFPAPSLVSTSYTGYLAESHLELPNLLCGSETGSGIHTELPVLSISGNILNGTVANLKSRYFPELSINSNATVGLVANAYISIPSLIFYSDSKQEEKISAEMFIPALKISSSYANGIISTGSMSIPTIKASSVTSQGVTGSLYGTIPAVTCSSNILFSDEDSVLVFDRWDNHVL